MTTSISYSLNAQTHYLNEHDAFISFAFREEIKSRGQNFRCSTHEITPKMAISEFFRMVVDGLSIVTDEARRLNDFGAARYPISRNDLGTEKTEFSVRGHFIDEPDLLRTGDVIKVIVGVKQDFDDFIDNENGDLNTAIIATVQVYGEEQIVEAFNEHFHRELKKVHDESKTSLIRWVFDGGHGPAEKTFQIQKNWTIDSSYYPELKTDLKTYYDAFMASNAQILVIYGPPGTGKTSFIRDMICESSLNAFISYDLKILTSDSTFVGYMTNSIFNAIVMEDADELLTSARSDFNKVIAKILNISDGLIKLPRKKLIFTTNLPKVSDMDQAIIRPGRCFDVLHFRPFTKSEAQVIADRFGCDLEENKQKYTLSEIFLSKSRAEATDPFTTSFGKKMETKVGFV